VKQGETQDNKGKKNVERNQTMPQLTTRDGEEREEGRIS